MLLELLTRKVKKIITLFYDPLLDLKIGTQTIKVNLSHQLRVILKLYPEYNFNLARLVRFTEKSLGPIRVIDIGSNVGDSVAFIRNYSEVPILCIDGEENYMNILKRNTNQYENIFTCKSLVGVENKKENVTLKIVKGTAHIEKAKEEVEVRTLENILSDFPNFTNSKILKSDTDGFDTWILRASSNYLKSIKPILFFEFDPHFIRLNNDDPFEFINYLKEVGYKYLIFYTNVGDFLISCKIDDTEIINQIIHYYSGRNIETFVDICAFTEVDMTLFENFVKEELEHFKKVRKY